MNIGNTYTRDAAIKSHVKYFQPVKITHEIVLAYIRGIKMYHEIK